MPKAVHYTTGQRFEGTRLCFLNEVPKVNPKERRALFKCDCGNTIETAINWVRSLNTISCGCFKKEVVADKNTKHSNAARGKASGAYRSWQAMHQRVKSNVNYANISICERWSGENGFANFLEDMGERPEGLTIERENNLGNYEPSNCKWATYSEQAQNTSRTVKVEIDGETHSVKEWCRIKGMSYALVKKRRKNGMSIVEAITKPVDASKRNHLAKARIVREYHIDGSMPDPDSGVIWTFGSNLHGYHSLGAAIVAVRMFGAIRYQGEGRQGNAYAIPTRWWDMTLKRMFTLPLETVVENIARFCDYTRQNQDLKFFVTAVGTGYAGFKMETIVPLFKDAVNCSFPEEWDLLLED